MYLFLVLGHSVSSASFVCQRSCCILLIGRFDPFTICYMFAVLNTLAAYWFLDSSCHRILFLLLSNALSLWILFLCHLYTDSSCPHLVFLLGILVLFVLYLVIVCLCLLSGICTLQLGSLQFLSYFTVWSTIFCSSWVALGLSAEL